MVQAVLVSKRGTLLLPETKLPTDRPSTGDSAAIDFVRLATWILGTCSPVDEVRQALTGVQIWNAPVRRLWSTDKPMPDSLKPLVDYAFTEHLIFHDAHGGDLVVEFLNGVAVLHDNVIGVLANSPTYDWHLINLRNYIGLTNVEDKPVNLMGVPVTATGADRSRDFGQGRAGRGKPGLPLAGPGQRSALFGGFR